MSRPHEETRLHTRLLKCTLELENSRIFWGLAGSGGVLTAEQAFEEGWFGHRSLIRLQELLGNLRVRFDAFPSALQVLHGWKEMAPDTQRLICHWHLQMADPLYRRFTGFFLPDQLSHGHLTLSKQQVVRWLVAVTGERWAMSTRLQIASKLLSSAFAAGLIGTRRDPRPITFPRVPEEALSYLLYLLREVEINGTMLDNPYLASVGLMGEFLDDRLRGLPGLAFGRQGELVDMGWRHSDLTTWADKNGVSLSPVEEAVAS
jgi:hypothetical protein